MPNPLLSIIIPVYNEDRLAVDSLPPIFDLPINKEVIVVNDGSTDNTAAVLAGLAKQYDFRLLNQPTNQGKGAAVKRGLSEIKGNYFIVCDADQEYQASDIIKLFTAMLDGADERTVIYGSRFLGYPPLTFHYLANRFLTGLTNLLFNSQLTDMETCFKLVPASALSQIKLSGRRFEVEPELTAQLLKAGYRIKESPISYRRRGYQEGKKIRARDGLLAIMSLLRERLIR
ncbi:MAG: glycosyltransferase family 2 protein [Patescibacteria group bacterium]